MIRMVQAVHRSVEGVAADGRPYSASDPATLAWVPKTSQACSAGNST